MTPVRTPTIPLFFPTNHVGNYLRIFINSERWPTLSRGESASYHSYLSYRCCLGNPQSPRQLWRQHPLTIKLWKSFQWTAEVSVLPTERTFIASCNTNGCHSCSRNLRGCFVTDTRHPKQQLTPPATAGPPLRLQGLLCTSAKVFFTRNRLNTSSKRQLM